MDYNFKDFLNRLQKAKANKNLRVEDISKKSGVPIGTLSKILAGITTDPKINTVISIANALEISIDYLIYGTITQDYYTDKEEMFIKKYRQLNADGKEEIDDLIDVKLAKIQRKAEEEENFA